MKIRLATSCLVVGALLAPVAALADDGDSDRAHPMTYAKDSLITTKVKAKLADEKLSSLASIQVDTDSWGAVVLTGRVRSQEESTKAVAIARGVEGVTSVKSNLQIRRDD
jgi:hyperosmotically inducible protein